MSGVKVLLVGATGSGKTYSIRSLCDQVERVFLLATEPGALEVLGDIPDSKLHYHYVAPANPSFEAMVKSATTINQLSFEALTKLSGIAKQEYGQFIDILSSLANFKCSRCGASFGAVDKLTDKDALVVDSLSGINLAALDLVVGSKPVKNPGEWQIGMDSVERLVNKLCMSTQCHFVLTAHLERETNEVTGGIQLMASTLGRKLAPKLPRYFDDVIMCKREGMSWEWSTASLNVDLKARHLSYSEKLQPSFAPIFAAYHKMHEGTKPQLEK